MKTNIFIAVIAPCKDLIVSFVEAIKSPFEAIAVMVDETRRENLDGKYDRYWARKNKQMELRELRQYYRANKKIIKNKWKEVRKNGKL